MWLPPLPSRLALGAVIDSEHEQGPTLTAILGLEDDPAQQEQRPWRLDLARAGGHLAVIGAPHSGRSTLLRTIVTSLALTHTPRQVAIYGMDLTGGLQRIGKFPHVGGVASRLQRERLTRLIEELSGMLAVREAAFGSHAIDSMAQFRALHAAGDIPEIDSADIVLVVDGYGLLRQDFPQLEDPFVEIMVRAASFGLHCVLGMTRWSELRMGHQALFGTRIELRLNDPAESSIDRKLSSLLSVDTPGRVLLDSKRFAQVGLPVLELVGDDAVGDELEALAGRTALAWVGRPAAPIRMLPLQLNPDELPDEFEEPDVVPIGRRQDTMEFAFWDLAGADQHLLVLGDADSGKSTLLRTIATGLMARFTTDDLDIAVVDSRATSRARLPPTTSQRTRTTPPRPPVSPSRSRRNWNDAPATPPHRAGHGTSCCWWTTTTSSRPAARNHCRHCCRTCPAHGTWACIWSSPGPSPVRRRGCTARPCRRCATPARSC